MFRGLLLLVFLIGIATSEIAVNAPGWKATPFPHQTSDIPSVVLFSRSNASAVFITKDNKHAYAVSDNRGKTWGPAIVVPGVPVTAGATLVASSTESFYVFYTNNTISTYRLMNAQYTAVTPLLTDADLRLMVATRGAWHKTTLWGATSCGGSCVAALYGLVYNFELTWTYNLTFAISHDYGASWTKTVIDHWERTNGAEQTVLTSCALAFHHGTFVIGMSSRSSLQDPIHKDMWRMSKDLGKNWKTFIGYSGYTTHSSALIDLQIIGRRNNRWSAVGLLETTKRPIFLAGSDDDASWREVEASTGFVYIAEFHQGLVAVKPAGASLSLKISLHAGTTWGTTRPLLAIDGKQFSSSFTRYAYFDLPYAIAAVTVTSEPYILTLEDCGDNTADISTDSIPYTCCRINGCGNTPQPPSPTPGGNPPSPPPRTPPAAPPSIVDQLGLDGDALAIGLLGLFVTVSAIMAIVSIIRRKMRTANTYSDMSLMVNNPEENLSDSDGIALDVH